jgi:hypothetical protein
MQRMRLVGIIRDLFFALARRENKYTTAFTELTAFFIGFAKISYSAVMRTSGLEKEPANISVFFTDHYDHIVWRISQLCF